jgi:hypothetical protein
MNLVESSVNKYIKMATIKLLHDCKYSWHKIKCGMEDMYRNFRRSFCLRLQRTIPSTLTKKKGVFSTFLVAVFQTLRHISLKRDIFTITTLKIPGSKDVNLWSNNPCS